MRHSRWYRWAATSGPFYALLELAWWLLNRDRNLWTKAHASYAWTGCEQ